MTYIHTYTHTYPFSQHSCERTRAKQLSFRNHRCTLYIQNIVRQPPLYLYICHTHVHVNVYHMWVHVHARQLLLYLIVRQPPLYCIYRYNGGCMYMQDNCCYICTQAIHTQKCMCIICGVKSVDEEFLQPPLYLYILQPPLYLYMRHTWRHEQHFAHASHTSPLCTHKARSKAVNI